MSLPRLYFMYGYPASGKTTWSSIFCKCHPEVVRLSADETREELYGSRDIYGDGEEIYLHILKKMLTALEKGNSVVYDACNLYKSFRMDYLNEINKYNIDCYKIIIRMNTDEKTCRDRHEKRNRNFDIEKIAHYFNIDEPPTMDEGWDEIRNYSYSPNVKTFYIVSPFFNPEHRKRAIAVAEHLRKRGDIVYLPCEHKLEGAYDMPNHVWGEHVFWQDVKNIQASDAVICLSYGREGSAGTAWELGFAFGYGIPSVVVEMPEVELMSIMVSNGCTAVVKNLEELYNYDFNNMPIVRDGEMEQK